jgi:Ca2+-binding RTX toxin-like protein
MNSRTHILALLAAVGATLAVLTLGAAQAHEGRAATAAAVTCNSKPATIVGTNGNDTINGTAGADVIHTRAGNDLVRSLGGDDTVCLGTGRDIVKGGAGNDTFAAEAALDGRDNFVGDAGRDQVRYSARSVGVDVRIDGAPNDGQAGERDDVERSVEDVVGTPADDFVIGSESDNALFGGNGDDDLRGSVGNDSISGGNDNDQLIGNAGDDFMFGNAGDDTSIAAVVEDGADFFEGSVGRDTMSYEARSQSVFVSINDVANDGASGEADNVRTDVENVSGGSGQDNLIANAFQPEANKLEGNGGVDFLSTRDAPVLANDIADGGSATDTCFTDADDVRVSCEQ